MKNLIKFTFIAALFITNIAQAQKKVPFYLHAGYHAYGPIPIIYIYENETIIQEIFTNTPSFGYKMGSGPLSISIDCGTINLGDTITWEGSYPLVFTGAEAVENLHTISADTIPIGAQSFHFDFDNATWRTKKFEYVPKVPGFYLYKCLYHGRMKGCFSVAGTNITSIENSTQKIEHVPMLYPNPANEYISVVLHNNDKYVLDIINSEGNTIKTLRTEGTSLYKIDISELQSGTYILNVKYCACQKPKLGCVGANQKYTFIKI